MVTGALDVCEKKNIRDKHNVAQTMQVGFKQKNKNTQYAYYKVKVVYLCAGLEKNGNIRLPSSSIMAGNDVLKLKPSNALASTDDDDAYVWCDLINPCENENNTLPRTIILSSHGTKKDSMTVIAASQTSAQMQINEVYVSGEVMCKFRQKPPVKHTVHTTTVACEAAALKLFGHALSTYLAAATVALAASFWRSSARVQGMMALSIVFSILSPILWIVSMVLLQREPLERNDTLVWVMLLLLAQTALLVVMIVFIGPTVRRRKRDVFICVIVPVVAAILAVLARMAWLRKSERVHVEGT